MFKNSILFTIIQIFSRFSYLKLFQSLLNNIDNVLNFLSNSEEEYGKIKIALANLNNKGNILFSLQSL